MPSAHSPSANQSPSASIASGLQPDLVTLWRTVRKHWSTALGTTLAIVAGVTFYTLGQTPIYEAEATVQFDPTPPRPLGKDVQAVVDMGAGDYWNNREYYETQYKIIRSRRIALAVIHELGLDRDLGFIRNRPYSAPVEGPTMASDIVADNLRSRLVVEAVKESRLALVKLRDADPRRAQRILNTLVDAYVEQNLDDALASTNSAVDWLRGQLDKLKTDLESSEMALHEYKQTKNILSVDIDAQSNMLREEMKQFNDTLTMVRAKREELSARRSELARISADDPSTLPASELLQSSLLQNFRTKYEDAVREHAALLGEGKGAGHPDVMAAAARVEGAKAALLAEVRNIQGAVEHDLAVVGRQEAGLSGLFEHAKKQALELNLLEIEYNRLRRSKENNEKLFSLVLERTKESDLTRMMRVNNIRVLDRPVVPREPIRPRKALNILLGTIGGIVLGAMAALGRAFLDRTLKTPDDVERELGLSFLGLLPEIDETAPKKGRHHRRIRPSSDKPGSPELIVHEQPMCGVAEAARAIRTNLMFMSPDRPYRTLLVTSAGPSEGKSTVASCIAIAMAQAGQQVALVDCDLRRPRLHRIFGFKSDVGISTATLDPDAVSFEGLRTIVPNLTLIPAGPIPPNPAELLHSERLKSFLESLSKRFDRVIIDSPPLVAVTDPAILSRYVDGTILVARAFVTPKDMAKHGLRSLLDVNQRPAGVILNAVNLKRRDYDYYYYQYYRRSGYYYGSEGAASGARENEKAPANGAQAS